MATCKHENVTLYADDEFNHLVGSGHRCIECFEEFVPIAQLNYIRSEVASMLKDEYDNYAPDSPPISLDQFMDTLKELVNE